MIQNCCILTGTGRSENVIFEDHVSVSNPFWMVQYLLLSFLSCENGPDIQSHCTQRLEFFLNFKKIGFSLGGSGGTELERRYGDVRR